jgi:hypothetical protein
MHKYELTLRCATFNLWPENKEFWLKLHRLPSNVVVGDEKAEVSYAVRSYTNDRAFNIEKKTKSGNRGGPALWIDQQTGGRRHGSNWLVAAGEPMKGDIVVRCPMDGEIDVVVRCEAHHRIDESLLSVVLNPLIYKLAAFLRLTLDPQLEVSLRPQLVVYEDDGQRRVIDKVNWVVRARSAINGASISSAMNFFAATVASLNMEDVSRLGAASRRLFTLQAELDLVDRFCDAWEICDILSTKVHARGTIVSRIATAISSHLSVNKRRAENQLRIGLIYKIRKDLVHNGVDNPAGLLENLPIIENVALELLRQRFALKYEGNSLLEGLLSNSPAAGGDEERIRTS